MRAPLLLALTMSVGCASESAAVLTGDRVLRAAVYIEAEYDQVWRRFTEAEAYAEWYSAPCIEFGASPGDRVAWGQSERLVYRGTLRSIKKGHGLSHSFQFVGFGFDESPT